VDKAKATLLSQVQTELRTGLVGQMPRRLDASIQIHASHGANRQVEVLRDVLCALFDDDPQLEPRDVLVVCTNLGEYAPLIEAAFSPHLGVSEPAEHLRNTTPHPGRSLRVQVARHALARQDPVLEVLLAALRLNSIRGSVTELLAFAVMPPIADLFGFDTAALARARELLVAAHVSWGIDGGARGRFGLPSVRQGTWLAGVERLSMSLLLPSDSGEALGTASPIAGVEVRDAELIGALSELVSRLRKCAATSTPATGAVWAERLREWIDDLVGPTEAVQFGGWSMVAANDALAELARGLGGEPDEALDATSVSAWLRELPPRVGRPNYFNGNLLVTHLGDLDAVPHKVICVLGLDDRHFPGRASTDAQTEADDHRARSRQRLFNAILAAEDTLVVVTQGADPRSNETLPPSVCIQDLIEVCRLSDECST
jgi:exodeoxyribonuclease V gamma subunit